MSMLTVYPDAVQMPVPHDNVFWDCSPDYAIVIHGTAGWQGASAQDIARMFATIPDKRSAHFVVGRDGTIVQCVALNDGAGANGILEPGHDPFWDINVANLNTTTISIEHVHWTLDNSDPLTEVQKQASFQLVKWLCDLRAIPVTHIKGHNTLEPQSRAHCPGDYAWDELFLYLQKGGDPVIPHGWKDDGTTLTAPNGVPIVLGFRNHIRANPWDPGDWPLGPEVAANPVEEGFQQRDGQNSGMRQVFMYSELCWTASRGVYRASVGREFWTLLTRSASAAPDSTTPGSNAPLVRNMLDTARLIGDAASHILQQLGQLK